MHRHVHAVLLDTAMCSKDPPQDKQQLLFFRALADDGTIVHNDKVVEAFLVGDGVFLLEIGKVEVAVLGDREVVHETGRWDRCHVFFCVSVVLARVIGVCGALERGKTTLRRTIYQNFCLDSRENFANILNLERDQLRVKLLYLNN